MKECFIICPIGDDGSDVRRRSDTLLKYVLAPVLTSNGYAAIRADQIPKVGLITSQIINLIITSPLVIADLTGANPNVFYELAIRHATQEPYIQIIKKGEKKPFDIEAVRTIEVDLGDLDSVENAKRQMDCQIKAFADGHKPDSPISVAQVARLLQHDSSLAEAIAEKISNWQAINDIYCDPGIHGDSAAEILEGIDKIYRKIWSLRDFGSIDLEGLDRKLNAILSKLE